MVPIRKGDGTTVVPDGIGQVRTGDGRVLFEPDGIPDSEVDHFEWGGTNNVSDFYRGDTAEYSVTTDDTPQGDFALSRDGDKDTIYSLEGDGLPAYPEAGDELVLLGTNKNDVFCRVMFQFDGDVSNFDSYCVGLSSDLFIGEFTSGSLDILENGGNWNTNEWNWVEIQTPETVSDYIVVTAYEFLESEFSEDDPEAGKGDQLGTISASPTEDYTANTGIGYTSASSSDSGPFVDWFSIL